MPNRSLVWFRADLRVNDNHALHHACRASEGGVVGVFTICPEQWKEHDWAPVKVDFILRNLAQLRDRLQTLNIPLKIIRTDRFRDVPEELLSLANSCSCDALYFNREYELNERARDCDVGELFAGEGMGVHAFTDQVLIAPGQVRTQEGKWYTVFSPFKRSAVAYLEENPIEVLAKPSKQAAIDVESDDVPSSIDGFESEVDPDLWKAGEQAALARLRAFVEHRIDAYKDERNFPAIDGTSKLSPYLAAGVLSPRQCVEAAADASGGQLASRKKSIEGPTHWISEVLWREFYKHLLVGFPRVSRNEPFKLDTKAINWSYSKKKFELWCEGRTGYPIVDAAMRALKTTGWMHNRLRMVSAMFLTKDLFVDWRWGERHFMRHLVDGDLASNNGGWQWSASTGTDAAPYFRIFNPISQSKKFDPDGTFIREHVEELRDVEGDEIHEPWKLPDLLRSQLDYPDRVVDHSEAREHAIDAFKSLAGAN